MDAQRREREWILGVGLQLQAVYQTCQEGTLDDYGQVLRTMTIMDTTIRPNGLPPAMADQVTPNPRGMLTVSDREMLWALFNLVGDLYQEITGKKPMVCMKAEQPGGWVHATPCSGRVSAFSNCLQDVDDPPDGLKVVSAMLCP